MIASEGNIISEIKKRNGLKSRILDVIMIISFLVSGDDVWKLRSIFVKPANDEIFNIDEQESTLLRERQLCPCQ